VFAINVFKLIKNALVIAYSTEKCLKKVKIFFRPKQGGHYQKLI
jgi:hypothetical protein